MCVRVCVCVSMSMCLCAAPGSSECRKKPPCTVDHYTSHQTPCLNGQVLFVSLSVCLSLWLSVSLSVCLVQAWSYYTAHQTPCLNGQVLFVSLSVCLSLCQSVSLSVCLSLCPSVCLSVCLVQAWSYYASHQTPCLNGQVLFVCMPVCLSLCLSVCLSFSSRFVALERQAVESLDLLCMFFIVNNLLCCLEVKGHGQSPRPDSSGMKSIITVEWIVIWSVKCCRM